MVKFVGVIDTASSKLIIDIVTAISLPPASMMKPSLLLELIVNPELVRKLLGVITLTSVI